jgi:TadE-like protein
MRRLRNLVADVKGSEIAETAVVLPLVVMLIFGIIWFGRALNIYATIHRAAHEAAQAGANNSCATCGNASLTQANVKATVVDPILQAAHLDPGQIQAFSVLQDQQLNPGSNPVEYGTIATLSYPWNFRLNGFTCCPMGLTPINLGVTLTATARARGER